MFGGASLITEKAYLMGKFARVALGTRHIDYNGRLCMVSAGVAYKLAFDVDRSPIPWSEIAKRGSDFRHRRQHRRMRAHHHGLHLAGPGSRREADCRRSAHDADLAQRGSLSAAAPRHGSGAADGHAARDPARWPARTGRSSKSTPAASTAVGGIGGAIRSAHRRPNGRAFLRKRSSARRAGSRRADQAIAMHSRGIEHQSKGVENVLALINSRWPPATSAGKAAACTMITGQGNGQGGREHGQKCDQLPGAAIDQRSRGARACGQGVGNPAGRTAAARLYRAGDHERDPRGRDQGAVLYVLQSAGLAAERGIHARSARASWNSSASSISSFPRRRSTPTSSWPEACRRRKKASPAVAKAA